MPTESSSQRGAQAVRMLSCHLRYEASCFGETVRALRRCGAGWGQAARFFWQRFRVPNDYQQWHVAYRTAEGFPLYSRRDFVMYRDLFLLDEYAAEVWRKELAQTATPLVLDIGANVGLFAALCLSICPRARLVCFEMMPFCEPIIRRRLTDCKALQSNVVMGAVGRNHATVCTVHYDFSYAAANSIYQTAGAHCVEVPTVALDTWWQAQSPPFLVKIDVEGAEADVLAGGRNILAQAQYILLELHGDDTVIPTLSETHAISVHKTCTSGTSVYVLKKKR